MQEGTTSRVTVGDRPYGKFYDFYSISPENFGSTLVSGMSAVWEIKSGTKNGAYCRIYCSVYIITG